MRGGQSPATSVSDEPDRSSRPRAGDYRAARIGAAASLTAVLVVLLLLDALLEDYDFDSIQLGLLVGAIGGLLGIEAGSMIRGRSS